MDAASFSGPASAPGRKRLKFLLLGAGVVLSMGFLVVVGVREPGNFVYYLTVSEFLAAEERATDGFRVNGKVLQGSIERRNTGQDVAFTMTDGPGSLRVEYHGIVPDTFVDGADVVVEGRLEGSTFRAHTLLAKCPSKYESADSGGV
jgi:cytochrome c-type biogenesis protein CcmE